MVKHLSHLQPAPVPPGWGSEAQTGTAAAALGRVNRSCDTATIVINTAGLTPVPATHEAENDGAEKSCSYAAPTGVRYDDPARQRYFDDFVKISARTRILQ